MNPFIYGCCHTWHEPFSTPPYIDPLWSSHMPHKPVFTLLSANSWYWLYSSYFVFVQESVVYLVVHPVKKHNLPHEVEAINHSSIATATVTNLSMVLLLNHPTIITTIKRLLLPPPSPLHSLSTLKTNWYWHSKSSRHAIFSPNKCSQNSCELIVNTPPPLLQDMHWKKCMWIRQMVKIKVWVCYG